MRDITATTNALVSRHMRTMGARIGVTKRLTIHKNSKKVELNGVGLRGSDLTRRLYFLLSRCRRISSLELCPFNGRNAKMYDRSLDVLLTNRKVTLKRLKIDDHDPDFGDKPATVSLEWLQEILVKHSRTLKKLLMPLWLLKTVKQQLNLDYLRIEEPSPIFRHHDLNGTIESLVESNTTCRHLHFNRSFLPHVPEFAAQFCQFLTNSLVRHLHITFDVKADTWTFLQVMQNNQSLQDSISFESVVHLTIDVPFQWPAWDRYLVPPALLPPFCKSNMGDIFKFFPRLAVFDLTLAVAKGSDDLCTVARQIEYFEERMGNDCRGTLTLYDVTVGDLPSFPYELPGDLNYPPEVERLRTQIIAHSPEKIALKTESGRLNVNIFLSGHRRDTNVFM